MPADDSAQREAESIRDKVLACHSCQILSGRKLKCVCTNQIADTLLAERRRGMEDAITIYNKHSWSDACCTRPGCEENFLRDIRAALRSERRRALEDAARIADDEAKSSRANPMSNLRYDEACKHIAASIRSEMEGT